MNLLDNLTIAFYTKDRYEALDKALSSLTLTIPQNVPIMVLEDQPKSRFRKNDLLIDYDNLYVVELPKKSSCAHLMNLCTLLSGTRYVMICNDDVIFNSDKWLRLSEEKIAEGFECILLYNWGVFILDKKVLPKLGYADERFTGGCHEDADLSLRVARNKIKISNLTGDPTTLRPEQPDTKVSEADITHNPLYYSGACWDASFNEKFFLDKWGQQFGTVSPFAHAQRIEDVDWYPALTNFWREK